MNCIIFYEIICKVDVCNRDKIVICECDGNMGSINRVGERGGDLVTILEMRWSATMFMKGMQPCWRGGGDTFFVEN